MPKSHIHLQSLNAKTLFPVLPILFWGFLAQEKKILIDTLFHCYIEILNDSLLYHDAHALLLSILKTPAFGDALDLEIRYLVKRQFHIIGTSTLWKSS